MNLKQIKLSKYNEKENEEEIKELLIVQTLEDEEDEPLEE